MFQRFYRRRQFHLIIRGMLCVSTKLKDPLPLPLSKGECRRRRGKQNNRSPARFARIPLRRSVGINYDLVLFNHIMSSILNLNSSLPLNLDKSKVASKSTMSPSDKTFLKESSPEKKDTAFAFALFLSEKTISKCSPEPFLPNFFIFSILTPPNIKMGLALPRPKGASFSTSRQFFMFTSPRVNFVSKFTSTCPPPVKGEVP